MGRLRNLSQLAHKAWIENEIRSLNMPLVKTNCRYITKVISFEGVWDYLVYDRKIKRFMIDLNLQNSPGISLEGTEGVFCNKTKRKRFLIHRKYDIHRN